MNNVIENNICDSPLPFLQYLSAPLQHNINILRGEKESEKDFYRVLLVTARTLWVTLVKGVVLAILHTILIHNQSISFLVQKSYSTCQRIMK